jgi:hypothetical protein
VFADKTVRSRARLSSADSATVDRLPFVNSPGMDRFHGKICTVDCGAAETDGLRMVEERR